MRPTTCSISNALVHRAFGELIQVDLTAVLPLQACRTLAIWRATISEGAAAKEPIHISMAATRHHYRPCLISFCRTMQWHLANRACGHAAEFHIHFASTSAQKSFSFAVFVCCYSLKTGE